MTDFTMAYLSSRPQLRLHLLIGCLLAGISLASSISHAEEAKSDIRSLNRLFGAELSNNALEIRHRSRAMPPAERYEYLLQKVLPRETNEIFIAIDFIPTNPSPPVLEKYGTIDLPFLKTASERRIPSGGAVVSPAIDLIELAGPLGKRGDLKAAINRRSMSEAEQMKARLALLILIAAAEDEAEQYGSLLNAFLKLVRESPITDAERAPEMIVAWQGMQSAKTRPAIFDLLTFLRTQVLFGDVQHPERIKRHIVSMQHILDEQLARQNAAPPNRFDQAPLKHWHVASRTKAFTQGDGYPNAMWTTAQGRVRRISNHDFDYLYYSIPLRGDFEIEGELTTFGYGGSRLALGTVWSGPIYGRKTVYSGTFRDLRPPMTIDPPFSKFSDWMRVREVIKNGQRTTSINGRDVLTQPQGPRNEPWLAAMSHWKNSGEVRNLRITGHPEIPDEIDLLTDPELSGWLPYFDSWNNRGWSLDQPQLSLIERLNSIRNDPPGVLIGRKDDSLAGQFQESLLRYHRPMVEDGTIEYEFFHKENEFGVCPALDRCCFLFDSKRAGIHWLTDGPFDRTGLDPANFTPADESKKIPLKDNDWNRMELSVAGDEARVVLNGETILARTLEPENLRTFGLFHYADRTAVMVRNLRWRGEWPKNLPDPREQELADFSLEDELARGPKLRTVFEHDFSQGLPLDRIWVTGRNWQELTEERPNGLWMKRPGGSYDLYDKNSLSLPFGLKGDFDITWEFEDFQAEIPENGNGSVHLLMVFDDDNSTECRLYHMFRKRGFPEKGDREDIVLAAVFFTPPDGQKRFTHPANVAEHSTGGKLRIVRRGTTTYFLTADRNSEYFQLVHKADITDAPVKLGGIKGIIETHREGETQVLWKRVTIKSESIPEVLEAKALSLDQLDRERSQLEKSLSIDLNQETDQAQITVGGDPNRISRERDGWLIRQPGSDNWQGTEIIPKVALAGDFDVALELDVLKLEQSRTGAKSTVYLYAHFDEPRPLGLEVKCSKDAGSPRSLEIRLTTSRRGGDLRYDEMKHLKADRVTELRIARRGRFAYLIARKSPDEEPKILGFIEVGTADVSADSLRALVHTGGAGQETIVRFKSLKIHAEQFK